jgi:hypothetical protein
MTKKTMMPTSEKLIRAPAGPPSCSALPELTSNPGPMMPVKEISQRLQKNKLWSHVGGRCTSDRDHLQVSRLELALQWRC